MGEPVAIYILGTPTAVQRDAFKKAKAALRIDTPLKFAEAFPGCGRLISFEDKPEFFCDYALVRTGNREAIRDVLAWYLTLRSDRRAHPGSEWLSRVFGGNVREVAQ